MAVCPICNVEFPRNGRCPDHGGLVERIRPDVGAHDQGKLVLVATVWSEPMAQSWAQMLRNNGIPAMVKAGGPGFSLGGPPPLVLSPII